MFVIDFVVVNFHPLAEQPVVLQDGYFDRQCDYEDKVSWKIIFWKLQGFLNVGPITELQSRSCVDTIYIKKYCFCVKTIVCRAQFFGTDTVFAPDSC